MLSESDCCCVSLSGGGWRIVGRMGEGTVWGWMRLWMRMEDWCGNYDVQN